ncbi:MAG: hypothetical protein QM731_17725 [Chitinophagaceae bacterium]
MLKKLMYTVCFILIAASIRAQDAASDSTFLKAAAANAISLYYQFTDKQARLYNGPEHLGYPSTYIGHGYFLTNELQKGSLVYDGLYFKDVPMMYDLYKDELIIMHFNGYTKMSLLNEKLQSFLLNGHQFVYIAHDSLRVPLASGLYDNLYSGSSTVYAKRYKLIEERVTDHIEREFIEHTSYYILKNGTYYSVKTYSGLLNIFKDHSKEVRQYLRKNRIRFRKNKETAIVNAAKYYDALKK